jgi:ubiquinone/menaquinone biosynthesis C-methylase UbiE
MANYNCVFHNPISAELYNYCRFVDPFVLQETAHCLWNIYRQYGNGKTSIVDAGVGSGRLLIPVVQNMPKEYADKVKFVCLDVAEPMLDDLRKSIKQFSNTQFEIIQCDLQKPIPISDIPIGMVYTLATFHIIQKWKEALENVVNLMHTKGVFVFIKEINQFMHQTEGFESDHEIDEPNEQLTHFMKEYHKLRTNFGLPFKRSGIMYSEIQSAESHLNRIGYNKISIISNKSLIWSKPHSYKEILIALEKRIITTWGSDLPDDPRIKIAYLLRQYLEKKSISLEKTYYIPARFELHVFSNLLDIQT